MIARPHARRRGAAHRWALAVLMIAAAPAVAACDDGDEEPTGATETAPVVEAAHRADLEELNRSGVSGAATIEMTADGLRVQIQADGMVPDTEHPQHIHQPIGTAEGVCPTPEADTDGDGIVSLEEGGPAYGPVVLPLEPFPTAEDGSLEFTETYEALGSDVRPLDEGVVVLHGGMVDGEYVATLPVACGAIERADEVAGTPAGETTTEPAGETTTEATAETLETITIVETSFDLSSPSVMQEGDRLAVTVDEPGRYTFRAVNEAAIVHALEIEGHGIEQRTRDIPPGESAELTVTFEEPGEYELYCPIGNHREAGMDGTVRVG